MTETCANCRYFVPDSEQAKRYDITDRHCRRMPQKLHKDPEDWCGEWAPSLASSLATRDTALDYLFGMRARLDDAIAHVRNWPTP